MKESTLKKHIINWLITVEKPTLIAGEHSYLFSSKRADIIYLNSSGIHVIEIKSKHDNIKRLEHQLPHYLLSFNSTTIAFDAEKTDNLDDSTKKIGIMIISENGNIKIRRKPKIRKKIKKEDRLKLLSLEQIKKIAQTNEKLPPYKLIEKISKNMKSTDIEEKVINSIAEKYLPLYSIFLSESGKIYNDDDIISLERKSSKILL